MALPPLVRYATVAEYRSHYDRVYCRGNILTFDGIRVYFAASKFGHVFYESTARDDRKDVFSPIRAQRIDWIKATLEHPTAALFEGWDKTARRYDATRRVAVVYGVAERWSVSQKKAADSLRGFSGRDLDRFKADRR
jgi:hypothetical protein